MRRLGIRTFLTEVIVSTQVLTGKIGQWSEYRNVLYYSQFRFYFNSDEKPLEGLKLEW